MICQTEILFLGHPVVLMQTSNIIKTEITIDPFTKRHKRNVHNGGLPKFEALYCSPNMIRSTEIS